MRAHKNREPKKCKFFGLSIALLAHLLIRKSKFRAAASGVCGAELRVKKRDRLALAFAANLRIGTTSQKSGEIN